MPDWDAICEGFDYDLWANGLWLVCLQRKGLPEPDAGIFGHILWAQKVWLSRCNGVSPTEAPLPEATQAVMTELHDDWSSFIRAHSEDPEIAYRRISGEAYSRKLSEIARHVVNHGTYHRGELRGLCRSRSDEDFPETDFMRFVNEQNV